MPVTMEVCVDSVISAINAEKGGAERVELCSTIAVGGTTPTLGMLKLIKKLVKLDVFVLVRPRAGDFLFSDEEFEVMKEDIRLMKEDADGVVIGILKSDGTVDVDRCRELIEIARPLPVTFHRAIDKTCDISTALEQLISLGCERVLTSGGEATALKGISVIKTMVEQAKNRISIMPGCGINEENIQEIITKTGVTEFHGSARKSHDSKMAFRKESVAMGTAASEFSIAITDCDKVKLMISRAQTCS